MTTKKTAKTKSNRPTRKNSFATAAAASEGFHGLPAHEVYDVETRVKVHTHLSDLGELVSFEVRPLTGGLVRLENFDGARLAMNTARNQLFIEGGDQRVNVDDFCSDGGHESEILGHILAVTYYTVKAHLGDDGGEANYRHKFGEEGGVCPHLVYDSWNGLLSISGGSYTIPDEGIRN